MLRRLRRAGYITYESYHSNILYLNKFEHKQKYLADKSDSSESDELVDDVSSDIAYFVGPSFDGHEQGETACHMCGKSLNGIHIHRTACRKKMEKMLNFI